MSQSSTVRLAPCAPTMPAAMRRARWSFASAADAAASAIRAVEPVARGQGVAAVGLPRDAGRVRGAGAAEQSDLTAGQAGLRSTFGTSLLALGRPVLAGIGRAAGPVQRPAAVPDLALQVCQCREFLLGELDPAGGEVAVGRVERGREGDDGQVGDVPVDPAGALQPRGGGRGSPGTRSRP
jgi:hypothetical protein